MTFKTRKIMIHFRKNNSNLLLVIVCVLCACQSDKRKAIPIVDETEIVEKTDIDETEVEKRNERDSVWIKDSIEYSQATKILYEKEGDLIIGDFHMGMTHEELDSRKIIQNTIRIN